MAIKDWFKPGWKNSNPEVRLLGVQELTNQEKLAQIASYDGADFVRKASMKKIKDQKWFAFVAIHGKYEQERLQAVKKLKHEDNQSLLKEIAIRDSSPVVQEVALKKLKQQKLIAEIVRKAPTKAVRIQAISMIKAGRFQSLLSRICSKDLDEDIRLKAIEKLEDQNALVKFVNDNSSVKIRSRAVDKLANQNVLAKVAKEDKSSNIRKKAAKKLRSQSALFEIAMNDKEESVCMAALDNLEINQQLFAVGGGGSLPTVRKAAVEKILDAIKEQLGKRKKSFQQLKKMILSNQSASERININILHLFYITLRRCNVYKALVQDFVEKRFYILGPKVSVLLSTHFIVTSMEKGYIKHESDIRRLVYLFQPNKPVYSKKALSFDKKLEEQSNLREQYHIEKKDLALQRELLATDKSFWNALRLCEGLISLGVDRKSIEDTIEHFIHYAGSEYSSWLAPSEDFLRIYRDKDKFNQLIELLEKAGKLVEMESKLKETSVAIQNAKDKIDHWLDSKKASLVDVDSDENDVRESIIKKKDTWQRSNSGFFEASLDLLQKNEMLYEASCFCENVADSFKDVVFPLKIKSLIIRAHANFLRSAYKKFMQKIENAEEQKFEVQGSTVFTLQNNIPDCDVSFLVIGPTVEQIVLKPAIESDDYTSFEAKAGWYTIVCEPRDLKINPLILEGNCLPGKAYPIYVRLVTRSEDTEARDYAPSKLDEGYNTNWGLFGAIDIDPMHPLELFYEGRKYHIGKYLGAGSGGIVYQTTEEKTGAVSAFKFMIADPKSNIQQIELGRQEWQTYKDLVSKENIVGIVSYSEDIRFFQQNKELRKKRDIAAYEMEYADFGSLRNYVEQYKEGNLPIKEVLGVLKEIIIGLTSIHNSGLLHRDLRPENVLVFKDAPTYRICDFTLTRSKLDLISEQLNSVLGNALSNSSFDALDKNRTISTLQSFKRVISSSTYYAAPEEHAGHGNVDVRSDIYSVGGILYWLLVGFEPFELLLSEYHRDLYDRLKMLEDRNILRLDAKRAKELFGEWQTLHSQLQNANLHLKKNHLMEIAFDDIQCPGLKESLFAAIKEFLVKTLHHDPQKRYQSATELRRAVDDMRRKS